MTQKNELKNQLLTRKKVNLFQDKTSAVRLDREQKTIEYEFLQKVSK